MFHSKKIIQFFVSSFILILSYQLSFAQSTVKVKFKINTAAVPDILTDTSTVQIRGDSPFSSNSSSIKAKNVGGDYWESTVDLPQNSVLNYQFFTHANSKITSSDKGLEAEIKSDNGFRKISVGNKDTVLDLQWVNGWSSDKPDQYEKPFKSVDGSFVVWVRVNMEGWAGFDTTTMKVGIRGSTISGSDPINLSWGSTTFLTAEKPHANPDSRQYDNKFLWSGPVYIKNQDAGKGLRFKFLLLDKNATPSTDWNDMIKNPDKQYEIATSGIDTTLEWEWFYMRHDPPNFYKVKLNFIADLDKAITNNGFNPETDTLYVKAGLNSTTQDLVVLKLENTSSTIYEGSLTVISMYSFKVQYSYFKAYKNAQNQRSEMKEFYFDNNDLEVGSNLFNRKVELNSDTIYVSDEAPDNVSSHRSPYFQNTNPMAQDTKIILEVDYRPALNEVKNFGAELSDTQNLNFIVNSTNIDSFSVYVNGPITKILDGIDWASWNVAGMTEARKMYDDGTHGDLVSDDEIHTITIDWKKDSTNATVSQIFKFGINGGDNEAGYSNNHLYNIKDGLSEQRIRIAFGDIQPSRYPHWDYFPFPPPFVNQISNKSTGYVLLQNFPNPFNPTTNIQFSVPKAGLVKLDVIDLLGRVVLSFSEQISSPGTYQKTIFSKNLSSGTYLVKMSVGSFSQTKKMILQK